MRQIRALTLTLLLIQLMAGPARGSEPSNVMSHASVYAIAATKTVSVKGGTEDRSTGGSVVLLGIEKKGNDTFGWFATCYHVLHRAKEFRIETTRDKSRVAVATSKGALLHVRSRADIAIIRVALNVSAMPDPVTVLGTAGEWSAQIHDERMTKCFIWTDTPRVDPECRAYGFSFRDSLNQTWKKVRVSGRAPIQHVTTATGAGIVSDWDSPPQKQAFVVSLDDEITMAGMSGGPVFTTEQVSRFAGLVFGVITGVHPMAIDAATILDTLADAETLHKSAELHPFDQQRVSTELPFSLELQAYEWRDWGESSVEWESFDQWSMALRNDVQQDATFRKFQELVVDLAEIDPSASKVLVEADPDAGRHTFVLNGKEVRPAMPLELHPGENILVINKRRSRKGLQLNDLFNGDNKLNVWISLREGNNDRRRFHILRSLPSVIEAYSVYVTIRVPGEPKYKWPTAPVTAISNSDAPADAFAPLPGHVAKLVAHATVNWNVSESDFRTGSQIGGDIELNDLKSVGVRYVSSQTLDLRIPVTLILRKFTLRYFGLNAVFGNKKEAPKSFKLWLIVRLQFCANEANRPIVSVRALSAAMETHDHLTISIAGDGENSLGVDVSGLLSHLTAAYLNHAIFKPFGEDRSTEEEILIILGGSSENEWHRLIPVLLGLVVDANIKGTSLEVSKLTINITTKMEWSAEVSAQLEIGDITLVDGTHIVGGRVSAEGDANSQAPGDQIGKLLIRSIKKTTLTSKGKVWAFVPPGNVEIPIERPFKPGVVKSPFDLVVPKKSP